MLIVNECESYKYLCLYVMEMRDNAFKWLTTNYNVDYAPEIIARN
jgi:hypothetical protein